MSLRNFPTGSICKKYMSFFVLIFFALRENKNQEGWLYFHKTVFNQKNCNYFFLKKKKKEGERKSVLDD
jgi:hypothetical protein